MQRHPDAVVILWNLKDYDHVFFVTLSQLVPCLKDMSADHWSMIVFGMRVHPRSLLPSRMLAWTIRMSQFHFLRRRGLWRILRGTEETTVCKDLRAIKTRMCWMSARQAMMTTLQIWGEPEAEVCLRHREPRISGTSAASRLLVGRHRATVRTWWLSTALSGKRNFGSGTR